MRVVRAAQPEARLLELRFELVLPVDAHVPAGRVVVAVVDRPADTLGEAGGHGDREAAAGTQHAHQLGDRGGVVPEVLEHLRRDDAVERRVGERQAQRVAVDLAAGRVGRDLTRLDHRAPRGAHLFELGGVVVERDDGRAAPHRRERVAPAAAAHVEQPLTRRAGRAGRSRR